MTTSDSSERASHPLSIDRRRLLTGAAAAAAGAAITFPATRASAQDEELSEGGTLRVAIIGEPPAVVDSQFTTATITNNISQQCFEGLFAFDAAFNPQPHLIEDFDQSADGLTFSFKLRSGVPFHNGQEMTAEDVVASLNRWGEINGRGRLMYGRMNSISATDPSTVEVVFDQPSGVFTSFLARSEAFIMPAAIAEAAGADALTEFVGTGPYQFGEHQVDRFLRFDRFDDYAARDETPDGLAGRRVPYLDAIEFIPVPDESVRANGVLTGEYHFGETLPADFYDTLESDPSVQSLIVQPYYWYCPHFNKAQGLFTDVRMRQAVQLAFSQSEAMLAGFGRQEFVRFDPSVAGEETAWYSAAGADVYDNPDPERAEALLAEAGYNGEPIRWLATREYPYNYLMADYIQQQLSAIGLNIELVVSDWATLVQNRADPEAYEIFITGHSAYSHPATQPFNDAAWPGFWENETKTELVGQMVAAADADALQQAIDDYTALIWQEMPFVKCGDNFLLRGISADVKGYQNVPDWFFWNVGLG